MYKHDLTGTRYGRLTVKSYAGQASNGHSLWTCICDCGNVTVVSGSNLQCGKQVSCGCKRRDQVGRLNRTHAASKSRLYRIWCNIISRTENPRIKSYRYYGAKGVKMCDEWRNSFDAFRDWSMSHGYAEHLTIERLDNNKGYSPENCRWATWKEQFNHRTCSHLLTFNGRTQSIALWAEECNLPKGTVYRRLYDGWAIERALTEPVRGQAR